jgi:glycosyltransferase involved in cell wall biosynthesis
MSAGDTLRSVHVDTERTWGGGQRQVAWLAEGLSRRGHGTWVLARRADEFRDRLRGTGVEVAALLPAWEWDPLAAWRIRSLARRVGADLVVAHAAHAAALAALGTAGTRTRLVITRRVAHALRRSPLSRWKYRRAALIVAVSERVRRALVADGLDPRCITLIRSGVDLRRPAVRADPATLAALGLDPGRPLAVMVSSLIPPHKDPATFLRAIAEVRRGRPDLQALLVGGGPLIDQARRARLALGLEDAARIVGHRDDAERLLAAGTVAVLSSRDEGLGTTLLDAMLWGVPVVATAAGGVREIVRHGVDGLLSDPGDAAALAANLRAVLDDDGLRKRLIAAGRERVRAFSSEEMVQRTLDAYRQAVYSAPC